MIALKIRGIPSSVKENIIGVVSTKPLSSDHILLVKTEGDLANYYIKPYQAILIDKNIKLFNLDLNIPIIYDLSLVDITDGDIVLIEANGKVSTLYRALSSHNSLFITDRCNSNCLMCSQPPRNKDDLDYFFSLNKKLITLIPKHTVQLGITGGEPTLLGSRFLELLSEINSHLPETQIHILTNGRSFAWKNFVQKITEIDNRNIVYGVPLYSDYYADHDYIVQALNAYDQTILGLYNLARHDLRVELRIVLHKQSYERLPQLAKFIFKNLPFVEHIAFMGLEYVGYTPLNHESLWIEPNDYMLQLEEAVLYLDNLGMNVSIYNLQHCLLKPSLWPFSRNSISDWKQDYLDECLSCSKINECGGVFATSKKISANIRAIYEN